MVNHGWMLAEAQELKPCLSEPAQLRGVVVGDHFQFIVLSSCCLNMTGDLCV